jgi:hypothetical protein
MRKIQFWPQAAVGSGQSAVGSPEGMSPKSEGSFTIHHLYSILSHLLYSSHSRFFNHLTFTIHHLPLI